MKNDTIGNQQGNVSLSIGYLLGIIDGEGTVSFQKSVGYKKNTFKICPLISITNTDKKIIDLTIKSLQEINIPYYITSSKKTKKNRDVYKIIISGIKRVEKLIDALDGYYFSKKDRLDILKQFIISRKKNISEHPSKKPYTIEEVNLFNDVRMLNKQGGKSSRLIDPQRLPSGMFIRT